MFRELLGILLALTKSGFPLPDPDDKEAVVAWLHANEDALASLVAFIAARIGDNKVGDDGETAEQAAEALAAEEAGDGKVAAIPWLTLIAIAKAIWEIIQAMKK